MPATTIVFAVFAPTEAPAVAIVLASAGSISAAFKAATSIERFAPPLPRAPTGSAVPPKSVQRFSDLICIVTFTHISKIHAT